MQKSGMQNFLYCQGRNSGEMTIGKTHPTLVA